MSIIYSIRNTANTDTVIVRPGTRNGPDGALKDSDINLHGMGSVLWGEEVGENFIRLTENFACPEQVGSPGGFPQTSAELGDGFGINNPIPGQLWFNTTTEALMVYDGVIWKQSGGLIYSTTLEEPANPSNGDLWFNIDFYGSPAVGGGQLMIYNDGAWESVSEENLLTSGGTMTGPLLLSGDPTLALHAASKGYVDTNFLALAGGAMDTGAGVTVTFAGDVTANADISMVANGLIAANDDLNLHFAVGGTGTFTISRDSATTTGDQPLFEIDAATGLLSQILNPTAYAGFVTAGGDGSIPNKKYVVDEINGTVGLSTGALRLVSFFATDTGTPQNGDIRVTAGIIYIYDNPDWKQVFPAIYS